MKLNLGCGKDKRKGYINLDYDTTSNPDVVHDINQPLPFEEGQFDEVVMQCILEHVDDAKKLMMEVHRVSKPNAKIIIKTPHFSSCNVWGDIEHKRGFSSVTFTNENMQEYFKVINQGVTFSHWNFFMRPFAKAFPEWYEKHLAYIFNAVDINLVLEVRK